MTPKITRQSAQRILSSVILGGFLFASGSALGAPRVISGQWEYTMTTDGQEEPRKITSCMSVAEAAAYNGDLATVRAFFEKKQRGLCKIKTVEVQANSVSYFLSCGERTIENKITFHGDTSESVSVAKGPEGTQTMRTKARRLGACP